MSMSLVDPVNFLLATRDAGYTTTATALAELVDNSLEAGASCIEVAVTSDAAGGPIVTVIDDGTGMTQDELRMCLLFGGSSRFGMRAGLGRYGMGLPTASLSQARRVTVTCRTRTGPEWLQVHLDLDDVIDGVDPSQGREPHAAAQPTGAAAHGTVVEWRQCDRLDYKRLGWLIRALAVDFGRRFRKFISAGVKLRLNGRDLAAIDPLMLAETPDGPSSSLLCEPLRYEFKTPQGAASFVTVRFTELPIRQLHNRDNATKKRLGIIGGAGMSVLRGGREIAYGWHLFGGKRKENYDDWWRCELEFDPALDELFGITYTKQGVNPTPDAVKALSPDMEAMARLCNARVREQFESLRFASASERACRIAERAEPELQLVGGGGDLARQRSPLRYVLDAAPLDAKLFLDVRYAEDVVAVRLNSDHAAFDALYAPLADASDPAKVAARTSLELLLLAFARSHVLRSTATRGSDAGLIEIWSETLAAMLRHS